ncbi:MAG TPA: hypothetical protein PLP28_15420, partial [Flavobacteriales bacterium]|nr:hypothetical protein [Flavobacteriales bacterium]
LAVVLFVALRAQVPVLQQAEYFWDSDPGPGNGIAMSAMDGTFDRAFEQVLAYAIPPSPGLHKLCVRVKGSDNSWGPVFSTIMDVVAMRDARVITAECFWDADPGPGSGTPMLAFDGNFNSAFEQLSGNLTAPSAGLHRLSIRVRGVDNTWGPVFSTIVDVVNARQVRITSAEYFWDTDPGAGNGQPMIAFDGAFNSVLEQMSATVSLTALSVGPHVLHLRAKGADNSWGPVHRSVVHVDPQPEVTVSFDLKVALQGCMGTAALMNNGLRNAGLVPLAEPYSALGHDLGLSAGATTTSAVLSVMFPPGASVVDWILVEFHPALAPSQITAAMPLLLRRGGTVAQTDGGYPFLITLPAASYYVVVRHRNHLPVATESPVAISTNGATVAIDFTAAAVQAFGTDA